MMRYNEDMGQFRFIDKKENMNKSLAVLLAFALAVGSVAAGDKPEAPKGEKPVKLTPEQVFAKADKDGNGCLSLEEFLALPHPPKPPKGDQGGPGGEQKGKQNRQGPPK